MSKNQSAAFSGGSSMAATSSRCADILVRGQVLDELQLKSALARQSQWGGRLARHVLELGFASETAIADAFAKALNLQRLELASAPGDRPALAKVDFDFALERALCPFALRDNGKTLWVAMADPTDLGAVDEIVARSGCRVRTAVAGEQEILVAIFRGYKGTPPPANLMRSHDMRMPTTDEFALTDMNGTELEVSANAAKPKAVPTPPPFAAIPVTPPRGIPAQRLDGGPAPDVAEQLKKLQADLDKTTRVLRGLVDLCLEKQVFSNDEVRAAIARFAR